MKESIFLFQKEAFYIGKKNSGFREKRKKDPNLKLTRYII